MVLGANQKKTLKLIHEASVVISVHVVKETSEKMQVATCEVVFFVCTLLCYLACCEFCQIYLKKSGSFNTYPLWHLGNALIQTRMKANNTTESVLGVAY